MSENNLPQNLDAESAVLGSMLIDPDAVLKLAGKIAPEDFYREDHKLIARSIFALHERAVPVDFLTVDDEIKRNGAELRNAGYIAELLDKTPTSIHAEHYANIVVQYATVRRWIVQAGKIVEVAYDEASPSAIMAVVEEARKKLEPRADDANVLYWADSHMEYIEEIERRRILRESGGSPYVFPWATWNSYCDPAEPGLPILLSGDTGTGKTIYLETLADFWAMKGLQVVFAHAELNAAVMGDRRMVRHSGVSRSKLKRGDLTDAEYETVIQTSNRLSNWSGGINYLHCPGWSMDDITLRARGLAEKNKCDVLIYDYMAKAEPSPRQLRLQLGHNQREQNDYETFKNFLEAQQVVGVTADQLRKEGKEKSISQLSLSDIDGSGHKANYVNVIGLLHRAKLSEAIEDQDGNKYDAGSMGPEVKVKFAKNTLGQQGIVTQMMNPARYLVTDPVYIEPERRPAKPKKESPDPTIGGSNASQKKAERLRKREAGQA